MLNAKKISTPVINESNILIDNSDNPTSSLQDGENIDDQSPEKSTDSDAHGYKFVTYFNFKLYLQDNNFKIRYNKQLSELQSWFQSTEVNCLVVTGNPVIETKVYAALLENKIERIVIKQVNITDNATGSKLLKCYLIDVGCMTIVPENLVFLLPEHFANRPPLTKPYLFFKVYLTKRLHKKIFNWLYKRLFNKNLTIRKIYKNNEDVEYIQMFDGSSFINKEICDAGLGTLLQNGDNITTKQVYNSSYNNKGKSGKYIKKFQSGNKKEAKQENLATGFSAKFKDKIFSRSAKPFTCKTYNTYEFSQTGFNFQEEYNPNPNMQHGTDFSLYAIPPPLFPVAPPPIFDRDREIDSLKGEVRAYKELLNAQKQSNFSTKLQSAGEKVKELVSIRKCLDPFICDESALIRSITLLLEDLAFHSLVDSAIQEGNDLRKMIERSAEIPLETIRSFETQVSSLKLNQRSFSMQILEEELQCALHEMRSSLKKFMSLGVDDSRFVTYTRIGKELLTWKDQYLKSQSVTNDVMGGLTSFLDGCNSFFKRIIQGNTKEKMPQFSFCESRELSIVFDEEYNHIEKVDLLQTTGQSILRELNLRLLKMKNVDAMLTEILSLDPQLISERSFITTCATKEEPEERYPTLLTFITQSKTMSSRTKYMIVKDIFTALTKLHEAGETYFYLTPSNIFISGGAILCPPDKLGIYEPIPPFRFLAPECQLNNSPGASKVPFTGVGNSADFFSLGQIILWLSSVDANVNFLELLIDLQERFPILRKLISEDPKQRPSTDELRAAIEKVLPDVFEISKEELLLESDRQEGKNLSNDSGESSVKSLILSTSSLTEDRIIKMIKEEDELIARELLDSENESDDEAKSGEDEA